MKLVSSLLLSLTFLVTKVHAQQAAHVLDYIEQYKDLAIEEQLRANIPAAIKLAQGILESGAGTSELSVNAANHFGIKCKHTWSGPTYTKDDDEKDECFRKYASSHLSYIDHSNFLTGNKRYATLFTYQLTDYKAWANGLKKAGYATNPQYAFKLIDVIEKYNLNQFTELGIAKLQSPVSSIATIQATPNKEVASPAEKPDASTVIAATMMSSTPIMDTPQVVYYELTTLNGKKGFYARKDDVLLQYAIMHKIRYAKLLEYNDFEDVPLPYDMFVYLEPKHQYGQKPTVIKENGKPLHLVSQEEGIQLASLRNLNYLNKSEEPINGTTLYLQRKAPAKPVLETEKVVTIDQGGTQESNKQASNTTQYISKSSIQKTEDITPPQVIAVQTPPAQVEAAPKQAVIQKKDVAAEESISKPVSELDKLKQSMDQSVYGNNRSSRNQERPNFVQAGNNASNSASNTAPAGVEVKNERVTPYATTTTRGNVNTESVKTSNTANDSYYASNAKFQVKGNPAESLKNHMEKVKTGKVPRFTPKATGIEHTSAPAPVAQKVVSKNNKSSKAAAAKKSSNKKDTSKKTASNKKTTTKKATVDKKATAKKSTTKKKK